MQVLAADPALTTEEQKFSYVLGYQMGQTIKRDAVSLDANALTAAIRDSLEGKESKISDEEKQTVVKNFQEKMAAEMKAKAEAALKHSEDYLAANKKKDGVVVLPSGVQYKVLKEGTGKSPKATDTVVVDYEGKTIDGKVFDSSIARGQPATMKLDRVIKGWQEAVPLMKEGAKWEIVVPPALAYGARGAGRTIGPNEALVFQIELHKVKDEAAAPAAPTAPTK
jgi:FKBP-type peptidyl-prolyl cis-trans isomerase